MNQPSKPPNWWLTGAAVSLFVFLAGLFTKEETDLANVSQREKDHSEADAREFTLMQAQIDRRISAEDSTQQTQDSNLGKVIDVTRTNITSIGEIKSSLSALTGEVALLKEELDNGRRERLAGTDYMNRRLEALSERSAEIQRQVSAIEGRLGESPSAKAH